MPVQQPNHLPRPPPPFAGVIFFAFPVSAAPNGEWREGALYNECGVVPRTCSPAWVDIHGHARTHTHTHTHTSPHSRLKRFTQEPTHACLQAPTVSWTMALDRLFCETTPLQVTEARNAKKTNIQHFSSPVHCPTCPHTDRCTSTTRRYGNRSRVIGPILLPHMPSL